MPGKLLLFLLGVTLYLSTPHHASAEDMPEVSFLSESTLEEHAKDITQIETYLTSLTTIVADFTQFAPDGTLTSGKFFLKRPGKMRWQYNPPTPVLIIASDEQLVFYDRELEQVNYLPIDESLIGFMAKQTIRFDGTVGIIGFEKEHHVMRITLADYEKPQEGSLMLEFTTKPLLIRNLVITDSTHQITSVSLNNARFSTTLNDKLFVFRDPRKRRNR